MKNVLLRIVSLAALLLPAIAAAAANSPLYVTIDYSDPVAFDRSRYARANGEELILTTLKTYASKEAGFANFSGQVVVLDEGASAPAGAAVLRLTWTGGAVTADLAKGAGTKSKYLGVVSRTSVTFHPDRQAMTHEIRHAGLPDRVRDAKVRVATRLSLYQSLRRVAREQATASG